MEIIILFFLGSFVIGWLYSITPWGAKAIEEYQISERARQIRERERRN